MITFSTFLIDSWNFHILFLQYPGKFHVLTLPALSLLWIFSGKNSPLLLTSLMRSHQKCVLSFPHLQLQITNPNKKILNKKCKRTNQKKTKKIHKMKKKDKKNSHLFLSRKPKCCVSRKNFIKTKKRFGNHLFATPVFLSKFGLSVSSVWSPGLIKNHTMGLPKQCSQLHIINFSVKEPETERKFEVDRAYSKNLGQRSILTRKGTFLQYLQMSFFQTAAENLWCCWTASKIQDVVAKDETVEMEGFMNLQRLKYVNPWWRQNDWRVECQETYRDMEVRKLRTTVAQWCSHSH